MSEKREVFNYTYSASQQEEIRRIAEKYKQPAKGEDTLEQLRELDKSVTKPGTVISLIIGIISSLILGVGMCCTMVWGDDLFIVGIVIGVVGILGVIMAYPVYSSITKRRREKLAPEIIRLSNKLMK
ncbi:MAG: hypothetical protein K2N38_07575 [Oscillospiraceae bacterium]|nr:hypothetical protein [Oscillospiraceae bacterium]